MNTDRHFPTSKLERLEHVDKRQTIVDALDSTSLGETSIFQNKPSVSTKFPALPYPFIIAVYQTTILLIDIFLKQLLCLLNLSPIHKPRNHQILRDLISFLHFIPHTTSRPLIPPPPSTPTGSQPFLNSNIILI